MNARVPRHLQCLDGALLHMFWRCTNHVKQYLLENDDLKELYLELVAKYKKQYDIKLLGHALMGNHTHLLARISTVAKFSRFLQCLHTAFARRLNNHYGNSGAVVENRVKVSVIEKTDEAILSVQRYVLYPDLYPQASRWCGHRLSDVLRTPSSRSVAEGDDGMERRDFLQLTALTLGASLVPGGLRAMTRPEDGSKLQAVELVTLSDTAVTLSYASDLDSGLVLKLLSEHGEETLSEPTAPAIFGLCTAAGLNPGTGYAYTLCHAGNGEPLARGTFRTLPALAGQPILRFAVANDLHLGEPHTGCFVWNNYNFPKCFKNPDPEDPHWRFCTEQLVEDINQAGVEFLLLNGDISNKDQPEHYAAAKNLFSELDVPVVYGRGNHDTPHDASGSDHFIECLGLSSSRHSFVRHGVHFLLGDFIDPTLGRGRVTPEALHWTIDRLEAHAGLPTLFFLHHPIARTIAFPDWVEASHPKQLLKAVAEHGRVEGILCAHTHGARVKKAIGAAGSIPHVTTVSAKEYPLGWILFEVYGNGYRMTTHRLTSQKALAWNHATRSMAFGLAPQHQFGAVEDRNLVHRFG